MKNSNGGNNQYQKRTNARSKVSKADVPSLCVPTAHELNVDNNVRSLRTLSTVWYNVDMDRTRSYEFRAKLKSKNDLGRTIRAWRKSKGLTQLQFAQKLGIDRTHLSRIENGQYAEYFGEWLEMLNSMGLSLEIKEKESSDDSGWQSPS